MGEDGAAVRAAAWRIRLPVSTYLPCLLPEDVLCTLAAILTQRLADAVPVPLSSVVELRQVVPGVDDEAERRRGDADDVEHPEARLRDGRKGVVADRRAPRLQRVAHKHLLLVSVHVLGRHGNHKQPKDDHNSQPQAANHGGVLMDGIQEAL